MAPVGGYNDLLPYLVRRLLENGANTSFIHQLNKKNIDVRSLVESPITKIDKLDYNLISSPQNLFSKRKNSKGVDLSEEKNIKKYTNLNNYKNIQAYCIVEGNDILSKNKEGIFSPYENSKKIGFSYFADRKILEKSLISLENFSSTWKNIEPVKRIEIIEKFSYLLESNYQYLVEACVKEAGKTVVDAISDIREAIDFCRYYCVLAKDLFKEIELPGPTGEKNKYKFKGKGLTAVISPWNFPIAIFTGQLVASLIVGNVVLAKPAEQTSFCAYIVFKLLLKAGLPNKAASLILGRGEDIGPQLFSDKNLETVVLLDL